MTGTFNYEKSFMGVSYEHTEKGENSYSTDYRLLRMREYIVSCAGKMLDLGCGGGTNTEKLATLYKKARIHGCDISKTAIEYAKKYGSGKVAYSVMKGKKFPYTSSTFDVVVCLDVMEHVPDVSYFLSEVYRVLKKNGRVYFVVPCEGQPFTFTWWFQKLGVGDQLTHRYWGHLHPEFTHKKVISFLQKMPAQIDHVSYSEHWIYQFSNVIFYFLPKVILDIVLGARAFNYSDQGTFVSHKKTKSMSDPFSWIRTIMIQASNIFGVFRNIDLSYGKHLSFGSWKIHIGATKK